MQNLAPAFIEPRNATHRQYEALRAFFVDGRPQAEVAKTFGYSVGAFRVMCCVFRKDPHREFFIQPRRGPKKMADKQENIRERMVALRKQNLSIYDIAEHLKADGRSLTAPAIAGILKEEGFSRLPRRRDEERPHRNGPDKAPVANAGELDLTPRHFSTKFGGLFLFMPMLARLPFAKIISEAGFPGTKMIPADHAVRSILALKLFGNARHTHVMSDVFDEGLGLFAGLNIIPKTSFLSQYSCRVKPQTHPLLLRSWFDAIKDLGYEHGTSFDLDFHTIPSHGEDPMLQKHYLSRRSRQQKGILAFVANDTHNRAFCYVNADLRKETQNDEILRFIEFWKQKSGRLPEELVFDSTFATYAMMNELNRMGIKFITLRRRSQKLMDEINATPSSAWQRIQLENVARAYRTPRILENKITVKDYEGLLRQFAVRDLGHEQPTILITNYMRKAPRNLIGRYAQRMLIENNIADAVDFFHMDALSSTVALKVNFDLTATVLASTLYRLFASRIGNGYQTAKFARIFRDFISASAHIDIDETRITVRFQKRAHNPMLINAGFDKEEIRIPWLQNKRLTFLLG
jgi:transposase